MSNSGLGKELRSWRKDRRFTQGELAKALGMTRGGYANYESETAPIPDSRLEALRRLGFQNRPNAPGNVAKETLARYEVSEPTVPASESEVLVPFIGAIAASSKADWTDPFEAEQWEFVPSHMVSGKGLFSCSVASDCMMPMLEPEDVCVFRADGGMKLNRVVLYRSADNTVTIKQLKHDGQSYYLHPLNPAYEDIRTPGKVIGHLLGYVRRTGKRIVTEFDPDGLIP